MSIYLHPSLHLWVWSTGYQQVYVDPMLEFEVVIGSNVSHYMQYLSHHSCENVDIDKYELDSQV